MISSRSLVLWGTFLIVLGYLLLLFAFPILIWIPVKVDECGIGFAFPYTWSMTHGEETLPNLDFLLDERENLQTGVDANDSNTLWSDQLFYRAELFDATSSAKMSVSAYPLDEKNAKAKHYALAMQYIRERGHDVYKLLSIHTITVDGVEAYQSIDTFEEVYDNYQDNHPKRIILVATYVVANNRLYHISLIEDNWLNFLRDFKIYRRLIKTIRIQ